MARIPRMTTAGEPTVSYVILRTALDGFVLGDIEKEMKMTAVKKTRCIGDTHYERLKDKTSAGRVAFYKEQAQAFRQI